ncbi:TPA: response regulator transcription factor [Candidatus Scatousia excrementigallinarum]|uniref:Response regulator transcription factor n=1 Tax=Candidatus Scatousia excrementigallinarum TaxID=2840935 RepID=A0A9D1F1S6_9BACT|nr:response regulator transcription factor [Candidatus Scatousia excrementigallinarum]
MSELANILLVDDNPKYLKDALPFYGYNVETATDGVQALKLLSKTSYDLILLDVMMPNMNGWETLKAIRNNTETQYIPVIMLTAVNEEQKIISGLKTGADDYIVKPFILPNLLARMEAVLRRVNWQKPVEKKSDLPYNTEKRPVLTSREKEVIALAAKGKSNKEIAEKLVLREVTVKSHLNNIFKKLKVTNRTQAVLLAMQTDLID